MARLFLFLAVSGIIAAVTVAAAADSPSQESHAHAVARQVRDRDTGRHSRVSMRMTLVDRRGRERQRALTLETLRGGPGRPTAGDRMLLHFTLPNDIRGTGFLVWKHPNADDERFLYLPSLGRARRIAGVEAQESFAGSDFTYEDIAGPDALGGTRTDLLVDTVEYNVGLGPGDFTRVQLERGAR